MKLGLATKHGVFISEFIHILGVAIYVVSEINKEIRILRRDLPKYRLIFEFSCAGTEADGLKSIRKILIYGVLTKVSFEMFATRNESG